MAATEREGVSGRRGGPARRQRTQHGTAPCSSAAATVWAVRGSLIGAVRAERGGVGSLLQAAELQCGVKARTASRWRPHRARRFLRHLRAQQHRISTNQSKVIMTSSMIHTGGAMTTLGGACARCGALLLPSNRAGTGGGASVTIIINFKHQEKQFLF